MARRRIDLNSEDVEVRYATRIKMIIDLIEPKNLFIVGGRGLAKTSDILAERSMSVAYDLPGSYQFWAADTYRNALKNIYPLLIEGWERKGWQKNRDFVTDERPPEHWDLPYKTVLDWKHTITIRNGVHFKTISMDTPSAGAGDSYQHGYGDESKYLDFNKIKKLFPALRTSANEYVRFNKSPYFRGLSFTTDMPKVFEKEHDWILERAKEVNPEQIKRILQISLIVNNIKLELYNAERDSNYKQIEKQTKLLLKWLRYYNQQRRDSTFFYIASSLMNADILSSGYFNDALHSLGVEEFKGSVLSLKSKLKKGERFYVNLDRHHFYNDGVIKEYYDKYNLIEGDIIEESSEAFRYIDPLEPIEGGLDFGNMMSLVTGQSSANFIYMFKFFYTLEASTREIADKFLNFFRNHPTKVFNLYYDRSGNAYSKVKRSWAQEVKDMIEYQGASSTDWEVNLMSLNQETITQQEEYNFMRVLLAESVAELPKLRIDKYHCREVKSSYELAKTDVKKRDGKTTIYKNKTSEKLPIERLPMESTNPSDAAKYFLMRREWVKLANEKGAGGTFIDPLG